MSSTMWDVPGQGRATEVLRGAVGRGEPGHAWAFIGPPGVGQEQAARTLAAALNCSTPSAPGEPCGLCPTCDRCARGAFAAYREFIPVGSMHRKEDVREEWLRAAAMSPLEGTWKVLRVVDADRMNEVAANTFLKGLEEPPERTVWVLDIADPEELPDTILSRCRALRFAPWGPEELRAEAEKLGIGSADIPLAVRVANGSPQTLRRLSRPRVVLREGTPREETLPGGLDDLRAHRAILRRLREEGPGFSLVAAKDIAEEIKRTTAAVKEAGEAELTALALGYGDKLPPGLEKEIKERLVRQEREIKTTTAQAALDDLVSWCRDVLLVAAGGDPAEALHVDAPDALRADAEALGPARTLQAVDRLLATREDLERNVQQGLALEACFMELSALTLAPVG